MTGDDVRLVLGEEVAGIDAEASDVGGPGAPDVEDVAVQAGQGAAAAPQRQQRAGDAALLLPIGVVVLAVHVGARPVVLADGLDHLGIVELAAVGRHDLGWVAARGLAEAEAAHVQVEERAGVGTDHPLGQRCRLGEEPPVPVEERQLGVGP